jgi:transaldolase
LKFFLDTADIAEIEEAASWGVLAGVTTNPTLYARVGGKLSGFHDHLKRICEICDGPVNGETVGLKRDEIVREGEELAALAPNMIVKIPVMPEGLAATKVLHGKGIKVNATLCFSVPQALLVARAGASYVSPFVGRFDDISEDGIAHLANTVQALENYDFGHEVEVIAASIRSANHVVQAALMGADIATVPFAVLKNLVKHPLTDRGLDSFLADWEKVKNA